MIEKIALRLLTIKSRTKEELRKKLKLKGFGDEEIERTIQKFSAMGYLNDLEIAERRFEAFLRRGYGPRLVALKMKQQGIKMPLYSAALQRQVAQKLLQTAAFKKKDPQKQGAALQRRGFDLNVIYEIVKGE
jgi:regulatory protein